MCFRTNPIVSMLVLITLAFVASGTAGASSAPGGGGADLLVQVQAADVLSDLITLAVDRGDARVDKMQAFLRESGKDGAYEKAKPSLPQRHDTPLAYNQVFSGAIMFVRDGDGGKYADPALKSVDATQLYKELTQLQAYNIEQFLHLRQQRDAYNSMRAYLEQTGELPRYLKSAGVDPAATQAALQLDSAGKKPAPADVAASMDDWLKAIQAIEWRKAEARGASRADFDRAWQQQVDRLRQNTAQKVEGMKSLAQQLSQSPVQAPPPPQNPVVWQGPAPARQAAPSLAPPVQSGVTNASFGAANAELWNDWDSGTWSQGVYHRD